MSSGKTEHYGLHQWEREDLFLMEEFNEDNRVVDQALAACALVRLKTVTLTAASNQISIDLTDCAPEQLGELRFRISGSHSGAGIKGVKMTLNGESGEDSYLWADLTQTSVLTPDTALPVGNLTGNTGGSHCGIQVEVGLYSQGISCRAQGAAAYTNTVSGGYHYVGILSDSNALTAKELESVQFQLETSSVKFRAGTTVTVYGVGV